MRPEKSTWLWDTPDGITVLFEVETAVLRATALVPFCETTLVWSEAGGIPKHVALTYVSPHEVAGNLPREQSWPNWMQWWLAPGMRETEHTSQCIWLSRRYVRITRWGLWMWRNDSRHLLSREDLAARSAILSDLATPYEPPPAYSDPYMRTRILLLELFSRGDTGQRRVEGDHN